jgi:flagellar hook-associated protein 3
MGTWGTIYNNTMYGVRYYSHSITSLQEQITTGNRIIRASDEPAGAYRVMTLQNTAKIIDDYNSNLTEVELSLSEASNSFESISTLLMRVEELVTQASNGTYSSNNREAMAEEIDQIIEQCSSLANHQVMGRYIFGGQSSSSPPYEITRQNGRIVNMRYVGSYSDQPVPVSSNLTMSGQLVGERFFRNQNRQAPQIYGTTGAAVGSGTSSLQGDHWLRLTHAATTYNAGSGVTTGASGDGHDTILGDDHTITINAGTIRLDGGAAVTYTGTETDLQLTNADGDVVYVDLTGALVDGTWSIQADGRVALDDGTPVALTDFTAENLAVTDPDEPSRFLYINTNDIQRIGSDAVTVAGTYDVFGALIQARDLILNTENLSETDQVSAIQRVGDALNEIGDGFRQRITVVGGRLGAIDTLRSTLDNLKYNTETEALSIQQADVTELAVELARCETLYQLVLQVAGKSLSLSLLDYI